MKECKDATRIRGEKQSGLVFFHGTLKIIGEDDQRKMKEKP